MLRAQDSAYGGTVLCDAKCNIPKMRLNIIEQLGRYRKSGVCVRSDEERVENNYLGMQRQMLTCRREGRWGLGIVPIETSTSISA